MPGCWLTIVAEISVETPVTQGTLYLNRKHNLRDETKVT